MNATHTNDHQTSVSPRSSEQHIVPLPTHKDFVEILTAATSDAQRRYGHLPRLCTTLNDTFQDSITDSEAVRHNSEYEPGQALITMVRVERQIISAYNKHRLGDADWRYRHRSVPEGKVNYYAAHNLPDLPETFPFYSEVLRQGYKFLALELRPIYQQPDPNAAVTTANTPNTAGTDHTQNPLRKRGYGALNYGKLSDAPSSRLAFPNGNITLAEIAAFLPESIKSWDIIDRVIGNGVTSATLAKLFNHFRNMPNGAITRNSVYRTMKGPMDVRARSDNKWKNWTVSTHHDIANQNVDATSISVAGFRHTSNTTTPDIPFKSLADGVKTFPTGHDALDLTRCVIYCQQHPDEYWLYPTDYRRLLNHLPSGPAQVEEGHRDIAVIARWTSEHSVRRTAFIRTQKRDTLGRLIKQDGGEGEEGDLPVSEPATAHGTESTKCSWETPRPRNHTPQVGLQPDSSNYGFISDSDSDTYQGPKRKKKNTGPVRASGRTTSFAGSYSVEAILGVDEDDELEEDEDEDIEMVDDDIVQDEEEGEEDTMDVELYED